MESWRKNCWHRNSAGECPVFDAFLPCDKMDPCPLGEKIIKRQLDQNTNEIVVEDPGAVDFGQHKGKKWRDLPEKYLKFIISEDCKTKAKNKAKAAAELHNRHIISGQLEDNRLLDQERV